VGTGRRRKLSRTDITFPKSAKAAVDALGKQRLKFRPATLPKLSAAKRARPTKYGYTPEELLELDATGGYRLSGPEKRVSGWLNRHDIPFESQVELMGGRVPGGAVVDFVIYMGFPPLIIRIQSYWHETISARANDDLQRNSLEELGYRVEDVWEHEIQTEDEVHWTMMKVIYGRPAPMGLGVEVIHKERCPLCGQRNCFKCAVGSWFWL